MPLLIFLVARLIDSRPLCDAIIMAPPDDVGAFWQVKDLLYGFPGNICKLSGRERGSRTLTEF
jgi:hypothetical protein